MLYKKHFIPLESDPEIFTELMHDLGVSRSLSFIDVWSLDEDTLSIIPRPVHALILILPPCPAYENQKTSGKDTEASNVGDIIWLKQTINNACGLYAILHAVCNKPEIIETGSVLDHLVKLDPSERAAYLETSKELEDFYAKAALSGRLEAPPAEDEVDHHYICLVKSSGQLYELDGDMDGPISRGCLTGGDDVLTKPGLDIVRRYTESQEDGRFGLLALVDG